MRYFQLSWNFRSSNTIMRHLNNFLAHLLTQWSTVNKFPTQLINISAALCRLNLGLIIRIRIHQRDLCIFHFCILSSFLSLGGPLPHLSRKKNGWKRTRHPRWLFDYTLLLTMRQITLFWVVQTLLFTIFTPTEYPGQKKTFRKKTKVNFFSALSVVRMFVVRTFYRWLHSNPSSSSILSSKKERRQNMIIYSFISFWCFWLIRSGSRTV